MGKKKILLTRSHAHHSTKKKKKIHPTNSRHPQTSHTHTHTFIQHTHTHIHTRASHTNSVTKYLSHTHGKQLGRFCSANAWRQHTSHALHD
jgi:hypothetical protein